MEKEIDYEKLLSVLPEIRSGSVIKVMLKGKVGDYPNGFMRGIADVIEARGIASVTLMAFYDGYDTDVYNGMDIIILDEEMMRDAGWVRLNKQIDNGGCYSPTVNDLDDDNPPVEDSGTEEQVSQIEIERLRNALRKIANWELPETGKYWDGDKGRPVSYESEHGSCGVRLYIQNLAIEAIKK